MTMRAGLAIALMLLAAFAAKARNIEINQTCLPGFCVESRESFGILLRLNDKGQFRLKAHVEDANIYGQISPQPFERPCGKLCRTESEAGELRQVHTLTGALISRSFGPFAACTAEGAPYYVTLYLYLPGIDLKRYSVERRCPAPEKRR